MQPKVGGSIPGRVPPNGVGKWYLLFSCLSPALGIGSIGLVGSESLNGLSMLNCGIISQLASTGTNLSGGSWDTGISRMYNLSLVIRFTHVIQHL